jgi:hypothetical protein
MDMERPAAEEKPAEGAATPAAGTDAAGGAAGPDKAAAAGGQPTTAGSEPTANAAKDNVDAVKDVGDESRVERSTEIRAAVLQALGSFGSLTSGVVIVGDHTEISGPVVGRDFGGAARPVDILEPFPAPTLTAIEQRYVEPGGYADLVSAFAGTSILLLQIARRWGGTTTGLRLLGTEKPVYQLRSDAALATLKVEDLPAAAGFLLDNVRSAQLSGLTTRDLESLANRLSTRDTRMVVVLEAGARPPNPAIAREIRSIQSPPDPLELVRSHLTEILDSAERAVAILAEEAVVELLRLEPERVDVLQLEVLARELAEAARGRITVDDAIARFIDRSGEDVREWLDQVSDPGDFALIIALAALNGMHHDAISRSATSFERVLREFHGEEKRTSAGYQRKSRRTRLQAARGYLITEVRNTRYGAAEMSVGQFLDGTYPAQVLEHVWNEYDLEREALLVWLRMVAEDVEDRVRIRAAAAIGYLACYSFDQIRRELIVPWAGSGDGSERERAVAALALPARHPTTAARVIQLVLEWCQKEKPALRCTAARALGTSVGAILLGGPDQHLTKLAKGADPRLALEIGDSLAELLATADEARQVELLRMLDQWSAEERAGRQRAGVFAFLEIASTLWIRVGDESPVWWPSLLRWANTMSSGAEPPQALIARLWQRALVCPGTDHAVHRILGAWASAAERVPDIRTALVSLLTDVARSPRPARLVTYYAKTWRNRTPAAPDTAQRLLEVLSGKGSEL